MGQGFIQDFQFWGGDVVCGLTVGWASTFPRSRPEMVLKALWFHFADKTVIGVLFYLKSLCKEMSLGGGGGDQRFGGGGGGDIPGLPPLPPPPPV